MDRPAAFLSSPAAGVSCAPSHQRVPALSVSDLVRRRPFLAVVALALFLGLCFQGARGLWEPDEGRYTNVALQMLHTGDFISLRRNEESLHFTKPPLTYWAIAASVTAFGRTEWAVRLPLALAFAFTVAMVFQLGKRFVPDKPWLPALIYATSPVPFLAANTVNTDSMLAATEALAVFFYVRERFGGGSVRWLDAMWAGFGLAFLTKGPPSLLPLAGHRRLRDQPGRAASACSGRSACWRSRSSGSVGSSWSFEGTRACSISSWVTRSMHGSPPTGCSASRNGTDPSWSSFRRWLLGSLPWLAAAVPRLRERWKARAVVPDELRFLWFWLALPLLIFSLSRSRLPLVPAAPVRAVLAVAWPRLESLPLASPAGWPAGLVGGVAAGREIRGRGVSVRQGFPGVRSAARADAARTAQASDVRRGHDPQRIESLLRQRYPAPVLQAQAEDAVGLVL